MARTEVTKMQLEFLIEDDIAKLRTRLEKAQADNDGDCFKSSLQGGINALQNFKTRILALK